MVKLQSDTEFPEPSVLVHVTGVFPIGNLSPELWFDIRVTEPELSEAVGAVQVAIPLAEPASV